MLILIIIFLQMLGLILKLGKNQIIDVLHMPDLQKILLMLLII